MRRACLRVCGHSICPGCQPTPSGICERISWSHSGGRPTKGFFLLFSDVSILHLPFALPAYFFIATGVQWSYSLVDRVVSLCIPMTLSLSTLWQCVRKTVRSCYCTEVRTQHPTVSKVSRLPIEPPGRPCATTYYMKAHRLFLCFMTIFPHTSS